ncbi:MAG TPA: alpha-ketoacid dehydrogenase subunit beta [Chloroflexota bacterium]|nr:alpha-ketoacid dehydrogenase subunit beta [Chloroflexota bacterium]
MLPLLPLRGAGAWRDEGGIVSTFIEAVRQGLREEMARDERVILMGEDVGKKGGVFKATQGLLEEFGAARVIDAPLAESGIVGTAIGAAINGLIPVAEIQFADFIYPAMNQIISEASRIRYRSNGAYGCPIVIRAPYGGGVHGALYHSQSVEAYFAHVPGLKVVIPSTPGDAKGLLKAAIRDPDPVLYFEHKGAYRSVKGEVPEGDHVVPIGRAQVMRPGRTLTVVAYGLMTHHALAAAAEVAGEGIEAEVVDLRTLRPLDCQTILDSVKKTSKVLIVHEDNKTGGFGAEVAALVGEEAFEYLDGPIARLAGPEAPAMPYAASLEAAFVITPEKIAAAMRRLAAY